MLAAGCDAVAPIRLPTVFYGEVFTGPAIEERAPREEWVQGPCQLAFSQLHYLNASLSCQLRL